MNRYRFHLIVPDADLKAARVHAVKAFGGEKDAWFGAPLCDHAGALFHACDMVADEATAVNVLNFKNQFPAIRWFRTDIATGTLSGSSESVALGKPWSFDATMAACGLFVCEVLT